MNVITMDEKTLITKLKHLIERVDNPPEQIFQQIKDAAKNNLELFDTEEARDCLEQILQRSSNNQGKRIQSTGDSTIGVIAAYVLGKQLKTNTQRTIPISYLQCYLDDALGSRQWVDSSSSMFFCNLVLAWTKYEMVDNIKSGSNSISDDYAQSSSNRATLPTINRFGIDIYELTSMVLLAFKTKSGLSITTRTSCNSTNKASSDTFTASLRATLGTLATFIYIPEIRLYSAKNISLWLSNPAAIDHIKVLVKSLSGCLKKLSLSNSYSNTIADIETTVIEEIMKLRFLLKSTQLDIYRSFLTDLGSCGEPSVELSIQILFENDLSSGSSRPDTSKLVVLVLTSHLTALKETQLSHCESVSNACQLLGRVIGRAFTKEPSKANSQIVLDILTKIVKIVHVRNLKMPAIMDGILSVTTIDINTEESRNQEITQHLCTTSVTLQMFFGQDIINENDAMEENKLRETMAKEIPSKAVSIISTASASRGKSTSSTYNDSGMFRTGINRATALKMSGIPSNSRPVVKSISSKIASVPIATTTISSTKFNSTTEKAPNSEVQNRWSNQTDNMSRILDKNLYLQNCLSIQKSTVECLLKFIRVGKNSEEIDTILAQLKSVFLLIGDNTTVKTIQESEKQSIAYLIANGVVSQETIELIIEIGTILSNYYYTGVKECILIIENLILRALNTEKALSISSLMIDNFQIVPRLFALCRIEVKNDQDEASNDLALNADTIAENSTNNGVRSLDKYPLLASRELYWMSTTVVFLLACAKPYLVGAILWENQIDLKSLMLMAISNNFSYVRNRMSASIKAVENTIIQPIIGENYLNEYSSKTYVFDNSSIEFLISPYSVYFDHHGDSTMSDVEIAFNHVEQAICNYLFGPVPTKVIGKEIDNHGSTWEHQPRHHKSKIKKVVEEEELRREEEERRKKRDVERSSRANRAAARLAKKHGDIDQDNSKANYSSGEVKEALESNTVDMAIDLIDSEQTSSQEVALGAAEPTFEIPLLVDTSPAPLTTQYHHQIDLLNDVIIFSVINITRIIPVHVINSIQKYDQTYDFGSTLRQCTNPDFLCKSVTIENTDHENSIKKLTISRELVDTSANWIKSAILVDSAVIIERFPQLAAIYLALNSCGVLTHRLSLYNLWDTNNSKAFCNSQSSDIKMYSSLLANIDEVLAFEYNDAMMFRLIKRDNKFTNEVKIVMLIVDELVEWINSSRYENRTLSRLIDCIFSDLSRDDSKVLSCKLFLSILGVSVRRNKARPVKISKDVFDKDFVKDIEEILRVGPHSCSNNNDRQIANTINENDFISERRNNSCYYIDGVKEICRYLQHLARYDEVESIINHIVHATQIEITPSILSQNLELLLLLTHNKKRQKLLEMFLNIVNHHKRTSIIHYFPYYLVMDLLSPLVDSILTGVALEPITKCLTEKKPKLDNYIVLSRNQSVFLEIQYPVRSNNESFCMDTSAIVVLCKVVASQKFHQECTNSTSGDSSRDNKIDIISANSIKINSEVDLKWYKLLQAFKTSMNFITVPAINKYVIPAMSSYCELDNLETTKVIATLLPARVIIKLLCTYSYFTEEAAYGCLMVLDEWLSNSILSLEAIIQIGNTMLVSNTTDSLRRSLNFLLEDGDTNANRVNNVANSIQNSILLNLLSSNTTGTKEMGVIEIDLTSISNSAEQQTQDRMDEDTLNNSQSSILHSDMNEVEVVSSDFHNGGANFEDILKNDLYRDYGEDYVPDNVFNSILIEFLVNHYSLHGSSKIEGYYDSSYQPSSCYEEIFQSFYSKISNDNGSDVVIQITEHLTSSLLIMPIFNDRRNLINESFLWVVLEICGYYLQQVPNSRCALLRLILSQRLDDQYFGSHKKLAKRLEKQGAELDSTNAEDILTRRKMVLCTCLLRENEQNTSALVVSFEKLVVERSEIDPGVGYENILLQILHGSIIELTEDKAKIVSDTIANFSSDSRSNNKFLSIIPLILSSLDVLAMNAKQLQLSSGDYWYDRNHTSTSLQNGATYQYLFKVIDGIINFASDVDLASEWIYLNYDNLNALRINSVGSVIIHFISYVLYGSFEEVIKGQVRETSCNISRKNLEDSIGTMWNLLEMVRALEYRYKTFINSNDSETQNDNSLFSLLEDLNLVTDYDVLSESYQSGADKVSGHSVNTNFYYKKSHSFHEMLIQVASKRNDNVHYDLLEPFYTIVFIVSYINSQASSYSKFTHRNSSTLASPALQNSTYDQSIGMILKLLVQKDTDSPVSFASIRNVKMNSKTSNATFSSVVTNIVDSNSDIYNMLSLVCSNSRVDDTFDRERLISFSIDTLYLLALNRPLYWLKLIPTIKHHLKLLSSTLLQLQKDDELLSSDTDWLFKKNKVSNGTSSISNEKYNTSSDNNNHVNDEKSKELYAKGFMGHQGKVKVIFQNSTKLLQNSSFWLLITTCIRLLPRQIVSQAIVSWPFVVHDLEHNSTMTSFDMENKYDRYMYRKVFKKCQYHSQLIDLINFIVNTYRRYKNWANVLSTSCINEEVLQDCQSFEQELLSVVDDYMDEDELVFEHPNKKAKNSKTN